MAPSRRSVLIQGLAIGAAYIAPNVAGVSALAQQQRPLRRAVSDLPLNDPVVQAWRDAVRIMKMNPPIEQVRWINLSAIHGTAQGFNRCPHGNWYFLPWHRAYLLMYERLVRQLTGFNDFALPYWDWTRSRQIPAAYIQQTTNGQTNSLFEPSRTMAPTESLPDEIVGPAVISQILGQTPFEPFGTTRPSGQADLDPLWIRRRTGTQGVLESNPHNSVHGFVGGLMGGVRSAEDPIFMMHHCNVDRIWALWRAAGNLDSGEPLWRNMPFDDHFVNPDGSPWSPKVSELLDYEELGYTYGIQVPQVALPPAVIALGERLTTVLAAPGPSAAAGARTFQASTNDVGRPTQPLEVPVQVEAPLVGAVARRPPVPGAGAELLSFSLARERAATQPRAFAFIREITASADPGTQYRVFVDCDYLTQSTPVTDNHYVGTFGFFGDHAEHSDDKPSVVLDLTRTLEKLYASALTDPGQLRVQILPVPRGRGDVAQVEPIAPKRVEIAFISA